MLKTITSLLASFICVSPLLVCLGCASGSVQTEEGELIEKVWRQQLHTIQTYDGQKSADEEFGRAVVFFEKLTGEGLPVALPTGIGWISGIAESDIRRLEVWFSRNQRCLRWDRESETVVRKVRCR